jgi:hypothetical protein
MPQLYREKRGVRKAKEEEEGRKKIECAYIAPNHHTN